MRPLSCAGQSGCSTLKAVSLDLAWSWSRCHILRISLRVRVSAKAANHATKIEQTCAALVRPPDPWLKNGVLSFRVEFAYKRRTTKDWNPTFEQTNPGLSWAVWQIHTKLSPRFRPVAEKPKVDFWWIETQGILAFSSSDILILAPLGLVDLSACASDRREAGGTVHWQGSCCSHSKYRVQRHGYGPFILVSSKRSSILLTLHGAELDCLDRKTLCNGA